jgi:8-oxo-dGTP diphosphatase
MKRVNVVYALLYNDQSNQVLMVNNKDHGDSWSLPGGVVEDHETLEQAIIREVQEETGLFIKIGDIISVNERKFVKINEHASFITFKAELCGGEINIVRPDEISEIKWIDVEKADQLMPYHPEGILYLLSKSAKYQYQE